LAAKGIKQLRLLLTGVSHQRKENEAPRRKQRGILIVFYIFPSPQAAGNVTRRDSTQYRLRILTKVMDNLEQYREGFL